MEKMRNAAVILSDYHHACHPERSEAQSKDPAKLSLRYATGLLDFARNDVGTWLQLRSNNASADR
jgi:hypothetical protein